MTKEELENIDLAKSEFTRSEIEEMDKRAANIKNAIPWNKAWEKLKMEEELESIELAKASFTQAEIRGIQAENGIEILQQFVDKTVVIENQTLCKSVPDDTTTKSAFNYVNQKIAEMFYLEIFKI